MNLKKEAAGNICLYFFLVFPFLAEQRAERGKERERNGIRKIRNIRKRMAKHHRTRTKWAFENNTI